MRALLVALPALSLGCAHPPTLEPSPGAHRVAGREAAVELVAGVRIEADGDAWDGDPGDLEQTLTPLLVTLENRGDRPIRVSYGDFALVGGSGFRYVALPPFRPYGGSPGYGAAQPEAIELVSAAAYEDQGRPQHVAPTGRPVAPRPLAPRRALPGRPLPPAARALPARPLPPSVGGARGRPGGVHPSDRVFVHGRDAAPLRPRFRHRRFGLARHQRRFFVGVGVWPYAFYYDPLYYDRTYDLWPEPLPTRDMLEQALPEGVLEPGGSVSGFVYFQGIGRREAQVTVEVQLADAETGALLGRARLPFRVGRR